MSRPKMRAVPECGLWKPSRALISVDLPAPFGPSSPMDLPVSVAVNFFRMARLPKRTSKPSSSITGSIPLFKRRLTPACSHELAERQCVLQIARDQIGEADPHQVAAGRHADTVRLAIGGDQHRLHVAEGLQRPRLSAASGKPGRCEGAEQPDHRS